MKTKTINIYTFNELSEEIKEKVIDEFRINDEFFYGTDYIKTLEAFCEYFDLKLLDYSLGDYQYNNIKIDWDYIPRNKSIFKVSKKWIESCPFTDCCYDIDILMPLTKSLKGKTVEEIILECFESLIDAYMKELNYWLSEESIREDINSNGYYFTIDGEMTSEI